MEDQNTTTGQPQVGSDAGFADWPDDRITELSELRDMLNEISGLNRGSDFMGKVQKAIKLSEKLTRTDFASRRKSFCAFLQDEAFKGSANAAGELPPPSAPKSSTAAPGG